ncbi:MAG TPA: hypothetical protein G4O08_13325 [Anaerolineae bacterium]|nr:hypothetical protein [Anaerolineae bacterium]
MAFQHDRYLLKRQVFALTGKVRIYTPDGSLATYSEQKMFRLREDIRLFADEQKQQELIWIQARQILDFAAAYDVVDTTQATKIGALRRRGFRSLVRDKWEILDTNDMPIGALWEDSAGRALVRRLLLGSLLPQRYDVFIGEQVVAQFAQRFNLFRYELDLDFSADFSKRLDRRLGLAAAVLLGIIEGRQR